MPRSKRKAYIKEAFGGKTRRRPEPGKPLPGVKLSVLWKPILLVAIVGVLAWQWPKIGAAAQKIHDLLGWGGLALIVIAVCTVIFQIGRRRLSSFIFHWNRWVGSVAFLLAVWGILGFLKQGGDFGLGIISYPAPDIVGILSISGLVIIGVVLVAPRALFRLLGGFASLLGGLFKRQPIPKYLQKQLQETPPPTTRHGAAVGEKPALPAEMEEPVVAPERAIPRSPLVSPQRAEAAAEAVLAQPRQELRQIAQEVWKKYGQSSDLVVVDGWKLPPIEILDVTPEIEFGEADNLQRAEIIEQALASYGVEAKVVQINAGPAVTQFGLEPGWDRKFKEIKEKDRDGSVRVRPEEVSKTRVKVERITSLANDLALALAAPSIRIEAPVPGKSVVGIEVPNTNLSLVSLRGVIETGSFQKIEARSRLALALGKGAGGESVAGDLSRMPHLLIAGATGSGKTVCLNTVVCGLLMYNTPNDVRFIMVDPKRVELTPYNSIPHLAAPVIVDTSKALSALRWLNLEMDQRYQKLATGGARNIEGYNKNKQGDEKLPYMVLIIDELADLMMAG
ncbi:MAG TPA: DNA translocase FtsK, partial [Dehalococcoidales bacterium]|nr:DNA translocase FtsK [Dehalococcoidales bacterium]